MENLIELCVENANYTNGTTVSYCAIVDSNDKRATGLSQYVCYLAHHQGKDAGEGYVSVQRDMKINVSDKDTPVLVAGHITTVGVCGTTIVIPVLVRTQRKYELNYLKEDLVKELDEILAQVQSSGIPQDSTRKINKRWSSRSFWYQLSIYRHSNFCVLVDL